jgi:hypothetical protein
MRQMTAGAAIKIKNTPMAATTHRVDVDTKERARGSMSRHRAPAIVEAANVSVPPITTASNP